MNKLNRTIFGLLWLSHLSIRVGSLAAYPAPKTVPTFLIVVGGCVFVALCIYSGTIAKSLGRSAVGWVVASVLSVGIAPIALVFLRPNVVPASASRRPLATVRPEASLGPGQTSPHKPERMGVFVMVIFAFGLFLVVCFLLVKEKVKQDDNPWHNCEGLEKEGKVEEAITCYNRLEEIRYKECLSKNRSSACEHFQYHRR